MAKQETIFPTRGSAAQDSGGSPSSFRLKLKSGVPYDEVISGLQKMIRRDKEAEALVLAQEMFDSGFHNAIARRLMIIAAEDIGLANPAAVSQVYTFCMGYLWVNEKQSKGSRPTEPLALYLSIMLLCRSPKNRECDDAQIVTTYRIEEGLDRAARVIAESEDVIVDKHTARGKERLHQEAKEKGTDYEEEAIKEFLTVGTVLSHHVEIGGNRWGARARELVGLPPAKDTVSGLSKGGRGAGKAHK